MARAHQRTKQPNGSSPAAKANPTPAKPKPGAPRLFAPHYDAGDPPFAALTPTAARASSLSGGIAAKIAAFAKHTGNGAWKHLPRAGIAARLSSLAKRPELVYQDGINACGPAIAHYLFARERTEDFVDYAIELYESGNSKFGQIDVSGKGLAQLEPLKFQLPVQHGMIRNGLPVDEWLLDWMLLAALRRSEGGTFQAFSSFDGRPDDGATGITLPGEMARWLGKGVGFADVDDEANVFLNKDLSHLEKLTPDPGRRSIVLLINVSILLGGGKKSVKKGDSKSDKNKSESKGIGRGVQALFPDHYCELQEKVGSGPIKVWTWGQNRFDLPPVSEKKLWKDAYFGALICKG